MKFVRYQGSSGAQYGVVEDDGTVRDLSGCPFGEYSIGGAAGTINELNLLAPVDPPRVIGVGSNYVAHIEEMGLPTPPFPMLFLLPSTTVIGSGDSIVYPRQGKESSSKESLSLSLASEHGAFRSRKRWTTYLVTPAGTTSASALFSLPR